MTSPARGRTRPLFFLVLAVVLAAYLALGFARTFYLEPLFRLKPLTVPLVIHGLSGTAWFALLVWQARLARAGRIQLHRTIGARLGAALAAIAVLSSLWIVSLTAFDGEATGSGLSDSTGLFIQLGTASWFTILAVLGFRAIRRPDYHKRYMIMASIAMLAPAYSRIARLLVEGRSPIDSAFLAVPLVAALAIHDMRTIKRLHPVTLWAGLGYLAYVAVRLPIARSDLWNATIVPALFGT